ncbi:hypothetical protein OF83DRAFT_1167525 [Amylostereum chailletii]|nr:hypothetical protein OF83DRAFT_1167525 [Amylostereum chailletii]
MHLLPLASPSPPQPLRAASEMAYTPSNAYPSSLFPTGTTSPGAFALFGQNPREAYSQYDDFGRALRPTHGTERPTPRRQNSGGSLRGFKKLFGVSF